MLEDAEDDHSYEKQLKFMADEYKKSTLDIICDCAARTAARRVKEIKKLTTPEALARFPWLRKPDMVRFALWWHTGV